MEATVVSMRGDALFWYQWEEQEEHITLWRELKVLLLRHFRPHNQGSLVEEWLAVRQWDGVAEYAKEFIEKLIPLGRKPRDIALGAFINGLQEDIKCKLRLMDPTTLKVAIEWAEGIEQKNKAQYQLGRQKKTNRFGPSNPKPYQKFYPQTQHPVNPNF